MCSLTAAGLELMTCRCCASLLATGVPERSRRKPPAINMRAMLISRLHLRSSTDALGHPFDYSSSFWDALETRRACRKMRLVGQIEALHSPHLCPADALHSSLVDGAEPHHIPMTLRLLQCKDFRSRMLQCHEVNACTPGGLPCWVTSMQMTCTG